jgi:hypothetical protein
MPGMQHRKKIDLIERRFRVGLVVHRDRRWGASDFDFRKVTRTLINFILKLLFSCFSFDGALLAPVVHYFLFWVLSVGCFI